MAADSVSYDHAYFAVCIVRTALPFYSLSDVLNKAIGSLDGPSEKVVDLKVLGSTNGAREAAGLWTDILEGERILRQQKRKAIVESVNSKCVQCAAYANCCLCSAWVDDLLYLPAGV